jgi:hypothetical protein
VILHVELKFTTKDAASKGKLADWRYCALIATMAAHIITAVLRPHNKIVHDYIINKMRRSTNTKTAFSSVTQRPCIFLSNFFLGARKKGAICARTNFGGLHKCRQLLKRLLTGAYGCC